MWGQKNDPQCEVAGFSFHASLSKKQGKIKDVNAENHFSCRRVTFPSFNLPVSPL